MQAYFKLRAEVYPAALQKSRRLIDKSFERHGKITVLFTGRKPSALNSAAMTADCAIWREDSLPDS